MQSNNPVFNRAEGFNGRAAQAGTSQATRSSDPSQWKIDLDGSAQQPGPTHTSTGRGGFMTLESVVEKTAITLAVVVAAAGATWFFIGDLGGTDSSAFALASTLTIVGALVGFGLAMANSFKKVVSPALVLAYAAFEGIFVGAISKTLSAFVGDPTIVLQAVLATMVAFAATLGAYRFFDIQVTDRMRRMTAIIGAAIVGVLLVNMVLSLTGVTPSGGLLGLNTLGLVVSLALVAFAVWMLIMDFDMVERGVEAGLPEREAWRGAFGLTATLVLLYVQMLRIVAILSSQE